MKRNRRPFLALAVAPLLLASALSSDDLEFHPAAGSEVKKELEVEIELKPEKLDFTVNGEPMPAENLSGLGTDPAVVALRVGVTEKYVEAKDGRPIELLRAFDELSLSVKAGDEKVEPPGFDRLEGKTVRFHWDEEGETYERTFHESEGDAVLLADLQDDMDLRLLLPTRDVSEGDSWEVAGDRLPLFVPGGMPGEVAPEDGDEAIRTSVQEIQAELGHLLEASKVTCKYEGARDEGGVRVGAVHLELSAKGEVDLSPTIERLSEEEDVQSEVDARAKVELDGEGTLLWDLGQRRIHAFEMRVDAKIAVDVRAEADVEGETFKFTIDGLFAAQGRWKLSTSNP